jgi:thymidylate synthase
LAESFPAITTKKLAFNAVKAELAGFLEGTESAARMRELGTKIWDANANADYWQSSSFCRGPDDLGRIYGAMWRNFNGVDQIQEVIKTLQTAPESRRMIVSAWDPAEKRQCLPPCHIFWQLDVSNSNQLNCAFYMRSLDLFLGAPFDIASYALLQHIIAQQTGFKVGTLTMFIGNCHIYVTHIEQVKEQLSRELYPQPSLDLDPFATVDNFIPSMAKLIDYKFHPIISAEMVV